MKTTKLSKQFALTLGLIALLARPATSTGAVTLTNGDAFGSSSFNSAGNWSQALAPHSGTDYVVSVIQLRTPPDGNSYTFGGDSLTIASGGQLSYKGTGTVGTITVGNLILNGGSITHLNGAGDQFRLAGNLNIVGSSTIHAKQGTITIQAVMTGTGTITNPGSDGAGRILVISNSVNTYTGSIVNNGLFQLAPSANLSFVIGASNANNRVSGTGTTTFNGRFVFDLSNASTNVGDSWTIASASSQTFGSTFSVDGFTHATSGTGSGTWDTSANGIYYEFVTSSGLLTVVAQPSVPISTVGLGAAGGTFGAIEADLLASYPASYAASVGGEDNAQVIIANTVAGSNAIQDQGGTGAHIRIAAFYQSSNDLINATTTGGMVGWLSGNNANVSDVVAYGSSVGADLVVYICQNSDSASIAGVSQQPGMYSALNPGAVWSAVFAHETGGHAYGRSHSDGILNPKTIMLHNYCGGGAAPPYYYTNPQIWFNGVQLLGDTSQNCSMGSLINNGDNSLPTADSAQGVSDRRARVVVGPNLNNVVLHWSFTNAPASAPASTTNLDLVSAAPAIVRGTNATYTGTALRIPGGTTGNTNVNSMSAYIDLPNGIISLRTNITIEIWATPLSAPNWARICDFGRTVQAGDGAAGEYTGSPGSAAPGTTQSSDDIMLSAAIGTDITQQRFEAKLSGTATNHNSTLATTAGVQHHYAITFTDGVGVYTNAGGRWQWYRDGDPIAYLDVNWHLAAMQDVNNWLGRSQWSDDSNANNDYAEVRIHNVALSRGEVLANFLLGPNYAQTATVTLTNTDGSGATSFNAAGQWSNGAAPSSSNSYETLNFQLRTPATGSSYTFGGGSLKVSGGTLLYKGTSSSTITITNLILNAGAVQHAGSGTGTLAGNVTVTTNGALFNAVNGGLPISANISGTGPITYLGNAATLTGNNSGFTGKTLIGNGAAGTVVIDSEARLGPNPAAFTPDQLTFNRGTLTTTSSMTLSNSNRGILIDISGGTFNVPSGITLTLGGTLSSPITPSSVVAGAITKTGAGTLTLSSPATTFKGTLFVDTSSNSGNDGVVKLVNNQVLANAHSPIFIRNNNGGTSTFQLDGTAGNLTLSQGFTVSCRNNSSPAIENIAGTNTINGFITLSSGGSLFNIQSDAGLLILAGTNQYLGPLVGARTYTFQGAGDHLVSGPILNSTNGSAVSLTKTGAGRLTLAAVNTLGDTTTLSGGTLVLANSLALSNSVLALTINDGLVFSNATAFTVGGLSGSGNFGLTNTAGNAIVLSAGNNNISATHSGVISGSGALTKIGTGQLTLSGPSTYTGITTVNTGTLAVSGAGSIANSPTITVAGGATLDVSGHNGGGMTIVSGETLAGNGAVAGIVTIADGATLSPGASTGTLTINGSLVLRNSSTLAFELGTSSDQTVVNGNLTLGGILRVTDSGGFAVGNYTLFTYTGTLTNNGLIVLPLPGGLFGRIVTGGGAVVLQVSATAFDAWRNQYFGGTNCALCGGDADFDGDGLSNTNEFMAGFDPTNGAAYLHIINIAVSNGTDMAITYLGSNGDTNYPGGPLARTNILEFSAGAADGSYSNAFASTGVTNILSGGTGVGVVTNMVDPGGATNSPARYYRVRVLVP